jgi:hypothetical protein
MDDKGERIGRYAVEEEGRGEADTGGIRPTGSGGRIPTGPRKREAEPETGEGPGPHVGAGAGDGDPTANPYGVLDVHLGNRRATMKAIGFLIVQLVFWLILFGWVFFPLLGK